MKGKWQQFLLKGEITVERFVKKGSKRFLDNNVDTGQKNRSKTGKSKVNQNLYR